MIEKHFHKSMSVIAVVLLIAVAPPASQGQAFLMPGDVVYAQVLGQTLYVMRPSTGITSSFTPYSGSGVYLETCAWHPSFPNSIFVSFRNTNNGDGVIGRADFLGGATPVWAVVASGPWALLGVSAGPGDLLLSVDGASDVIRATSITSGLTTIYASPGAPAGNLAGVGAYDQLSSTYYVGSYDGVYAVPTPPAASVFFPTNTSCSTHAFPSVATHPLTGEVYAALQMFGSTTSSCPHRLLRFDNQGNAIDVIPPSSFSSPRSVCFDPNDQTLLFAACLPQPFCNTAIVRISGGTILPVTSVTSNFGFPVSGLAVVGVGAPPPVPTTTLYGTGCGGATLTSSGVPALGSTYSLDIGAGTPNSQAYLFLALAQQDPGLPLGGGGCSLYLEELSMLQAIAVGVSPMGPLPTSTAGDASFGLFVPNEPILAGTHVYLQAATLDAAAPLGLILTNGVDALIY